MLDFHLRDFIDALAEMNIAQTKARFAEQDKFVDDDTRALIGHNLARMKHNCINLNMPVSIHRLSRILAMFDGEMTFNMLSREIDEWFNAVEYDARNEYFSHYNKEKIAHIRDVDTVWSTTIAAFPQSKREIAAGSDCYSLGYNTACIFHMCRVAEIGLRAVARERGLQKLKNGAPIDFGTWGDIIGLIDDALKEIREKKSRGPEKTKALAFYNSVVSDLRVIQSLYRDPTMHFRDDYGDGEALTAMSRVNSLMTMISSKIDEECSGSIPWESWGNGS